MQMFVESLTKVASIAAAKFDALPLLIKRRFPGLPNQFRKLKKKPHWGNQLWARGYCVDTVGLDAEKARKYVQYQEAQEKRAEQYKLF